MSLNKSFRWVAIKAGFPYKTVYNWRAYNRLPNYEEVEKLAKALHVTVDYLRGAEENTSINEVESMKEKELTNLQKLINETDKTLHPEIEGVVRYYLGIRDKEDEKNKENA